MRVLIDVFGGLIAGVGILVGMVGSIATGHLGSLMGVILFVIGWMIGARVGTKDLSALRGRHSQPKSSSSSEFAR